MIRLLVPWVSIILAFAAMVVSNIAVHQQLATARRQLARAQSRVDFLEEHADRMYGDELARCKLDGLSTFGFVRGETISMEYQPTRGYCICTPRPKCSVYATGAGLFMPEGAECKP